jgi:acyl-CoA oxidase
MFRDSLNLYANDEQLAYWMPKCDNYDISGCYAQTELGHGSNVAGLETTAVFNKETDEFVIDTPTLTSTKWWPGEMGRHANYAIVFARCIVGEKDHGVQPFLLQIRSLENHRHLPGIDSGDLGPKVGYLSKDNGWLTLVNVRIPRN